MGLSVTKGVADMHKYVQTRAEKIKLKAAQAERANIFCLTAS